MRFTHADPGQRIGAALDDLALPLLGQVLHHHEHPLGAGGEVHCTAHGWNRIRLAGVPVGEIACDRYLERAQHAVVQVPAAHHPEGIRVVEVAAAGQQGHRLLAGVDQVGILRARRRRGPHAQHAVLALQEDLAVLAADGSPPASATRCPGSRRRPRGCRAPRAPPSGHGSFGSRCAPLPNAIPLSPPLPPGEREFPSTPPAAVPLRSLWLSSSSCV